MSVSPLSATANSTPASSLSVSSRPRSSVSSSSSMAQPPTSSLSVSSQPRTSVSLSSRMAPSSSKNTQRTSLSSTSRTSLDLTAIYEVDWVKYEHPGDTLEDIYDSDWTSVCDCVGLAQATTSHGETDTAPVTLPELGNAIDDMVVLWRVHRDGHELPCRLSGAAGVDDDTSSFDRGPPHSGRGDQRGPDSAVSHGRAAAGETSGCRRRSLSRESASETDTSNGEYAVDGLEYVRRLQQRCGGAGPDRGSGPRSLGDGRGCPCAQ